VTVINNPKPALPESFDPVREHPEGSTGGLSTFDRDRAERAAEVTWWRQACEPANWTGTKVTS